ncbi:MAG: ABC transporter substrate-binding protein [Anaerolineales bacterium]|jgi:peptide/nickel transport system substrate-binding protein
MKKTILVLALLVIAAMALAACQPAAPEKEVVIETVVVEKEGETIIETVEVEGETIVETVVVTQEVIVEVEATPEPVTRTGAWVDTVVMVEEPNSDAAVTRLEAGDLDVYAYNIAEPDIAQRIYDSDSLKYYTSYGNYNELTFNPVPVFETGMINPFSSPKIREAMNWLIDRSYITDEISGGMARPRFTTLNLASKDSAELADVVAEINLKYAYNPDKAVEVITAEMEAMGAEMVDGQWTYNGEPVVITALIRVEDERLEIGNYVANLLEDIGFTVDRQEKTSAEASTCWISTDPASGCFGFYTGGWVSTAINRNHQYEFGDFYTPRGWGVPLWQAYSPSPEFDAVAERLYNSDYATVEERRDLMAEALVLSLEDSVRVWLKDDIGIAPLRSDLSLASDLSGSIYGSSLWAATLKYDDQVGGSVTIGMPSIMTQPWNPPEGTNWVYDMMPIRGMSSWAVVPDPFTGLHLPNRLEKAEVTVATGLPVGVSGDWVTLDFADSIEVPGDAWSDWDAENQVFITAAERFTETQTANAKVVMYYQDDTFDKMTWHDGSPVTIADMVMFMIMQFDRSKEASPLYDEGSVPAFESFMSSFKGWKVASENPLVIEYYTDNYDLDADNMITNARAAWPVYGNGVEAPWHTLAAGNLVEANGEAAYSADKADANEVEEMSYIAGPSLEFLKTALDSLEAEGAIPFEPTLGQYISADEAAARYANLQEWYRRRGHFWVSAGPLYLEKAFPVEGTLILQRYEQFPDMADKWNRFAEAPIPEVLVDGAGSVAIGDEAVFDVFVDFNGEPYAVDDIDMVKYLVFDATGELAFQGEGEAVEDGYWTVTLAADATGGLASGSNQLAVIVVSKRALVPITETMQFVTE